MKILRRLSLLLGALVVGLAPAPAAPEVESRVEALLARMTLEEKVGQLRQIPFWGSSTGGEWAQLRAGRIGSVLNAVDPLEVRRLQEVAVGETRLGIPLLIGRDVIHGFRTIFPIPLGQAATWNPQGIEEAARIAALEARSTGVNWTFAPMADVTRDPRWGRVAESPGEDPHLASAVVRAMVRGFQGEVPGGPATLAACVKHFAGYGASEGGRDYNTTWIPDQQLWEVYLPPYHAAVEAGALTAMTAFNDLNGTPCSGHAFLLSDVLRGRWGFRGLVVSDWASIPQMIDHGIALDGRAAALLAVRAGVDMEMASHTYVENLAAAVADGGLGIATLDERVRAVLRVKLQLGLFDGPPGGRQGFPPLLAPAHRAAAKQAAIESAVLLKNAGGVLPLADGTRSIAVIGPLADAAHEQMGTWALDGRKEDAVTPLAALRELGASRGFAVHHARALATSRTRATVGFAEAVEAVQRSDVAVLFLGEEAILSGEAHSRADIRLPGAQEQLVHEVARTGKPLVLVVLAGRPLVLREILEEVDAVLYAWHPGTMAGPALADLVWGIASPSGRLPITFPKAAGQIPIYYGHRNTGRPFNPATFVPMDAIPVEAPQTSLGNESHYLDLGHDPEFPFGFGLGYTTFEYTAARLDRDRLAVGETAVVRASVTNSGPRAGTEVVQLYIRDRTASVTRPVKELRGFARIALEPKRTQEVRFELTPSDLSFPDARGALHLEPGEFDIFVGGSSAVTRSVRLTLEAVPAGR